MIPISRFPMARRGAAHILNEITRRKRMAIKAMAVV